MSGAIGSNTQLISCVRRHNPDCATLRRGEVAQKREFPWNVVRADSDKLSYPSLDGLFLMIAEQEKKIRDKSAQAASSIISKVFGALK